MARPSGARTTAEVVCWASAWSSASSRRPERRARHGDLSAVEADARRRRRRGRDGQAGEERLGRVHARLAELRPVARDDGRADRRRRPRRAAGADRDGRHVRFVAVSLGRVVVQQRQQLPSLRRRRRPRRGHTAARQGADARRACAEGREGIAATSSDGVVVERAQTGREISIRGARQDRLREPGAAAARDSRAASRRPTTTAIRTPTR